VNPIVNPVMLALSTFRHSKEAINLSIKKSGEGRDLIIVYVIDINLARYFIGSDVGFYEELKSKCEKEILEEHRQTAKERVSTIVKLADRYSIKVKKYIRTGRFALQVLPLVKKYEPQLIITTRSRRPQWVKKFFGSPVNYLIEHVKCPVIEA